MKILLAPDSFKGSLTSLQVIGHLEKAAREHFPDAEIIRVPIADGGEGTVEAMITAGGGEYRHVHVTDPLGRPVEAVYGVLHGRTAVIEMAQASGLPLLQQQERNPLVTTTYGTGEMIRAALEEGFREILIGIGGSATNDGGMGAARALGVRFLDAAGREVGQGGQDLAQVEQIDTSCIHPQLKECCITVMCDVDNPLTGPDGATYTFGPQKGAGEAMLVQLEAGMQHYAEVVRRQWGRDMDSIPGAGAAGGLGAALAVFFGAGMRKGIDAVMEAVRIDTLLEEVNLVITGEGRMDGQSARGKVPVGIAQRCKQRGIPVIALVGSMGLQAEAVYTAGIDCIFPVIPAPMTLEEAMRQADVLVAEAADRLFRSVKVGYGMGASLC